MKVRLATLLSILLLIAAWTLSSVVMAADPMEGKVELPEGNYVLNVDDLQVKAMGGSVTVKRTWYKRRWHFNRAWNSLELEISSASGEIDAVVRNGKRYKKSNTQGQYVLDERKTIRSLSGGGYRWQDRDGDWVDYDANGRILKYGDRNNVEVSLLHDASGRLRGVFDHFGNQLLWYEYDLGDDRITAVRDASLPAPRRVEYRYIPDNISDFFDRNQPIEVTDAAGKIWKYGYHSANSPISVGLETITDPEDRVVTIGYYETKRVKSINRANSSGVTLMKRRFIPCAKTDANGFPKTSMVG